MYARDVITQDIIDHLSMMSVGSIYDTQFTTVSRKIKAPEEVTGAEVNYCGVSPSSRTSTRYSDVSHMRTKPTMTIEVICHLRVPEGMSDEERQAERQRMAARCEDEVVAVVMRDPTRSNWAIKTTSVAYVDNSGEHETRYDAGILISCVFLFEVQYERSLNQRESVAHGELYVPVFGSVTLTNVDQWYALIATFLTGDMRDFDSPASGQLRYTGVKPRKFQVRAEVFYTASVGGAFVDFGIFVNGVLNDPSEILSIAPENLAATAIVTLNQNDIVEVRARTLTSTGGPAGLQVNTNDCRLMATQVPHF